MGGKSISGINRRAVERRIILSDKTEREIQKDEALMREQEEALQKVARSIAGSISEHVRNPKTVKWTWRNRLAWLINKLMGE